MFIVLNRTCRSEVCPINCIFFYNLSYHKVTSILDYTYLHVLHKTRKEFSLFTDKLCKQRSPSRLEEDFRLNNQTGLVEVLKKGE